MEVDALALIVIVISVSLTTFVCSVLGKYCFEKFLVEPVEYRRKRSTRASRYRRSVYHCHHCPPPSQPEIQQPSIKNENRLPGRNSVPDHVAVNIIQGATAASSDSKLYTFAQNAPPINISNPGNPSQTFVRLGMRSSREARSFDYDHQFQTSESSGVADGMNWVVPMPSALGARHLQRQVNFAQDGSSFVHYEDISAVRNPGDGEPKDDGGARVQDVLKPPLPYKSVKPGSTGPVNGLRVSIPPPVKKEDETDDDTREMYNKLGIANDTNGDRLTPLSDIFEAATGTSSSEAITVINKTVDSTYEKPREFYDVVSSIVVTPPPKVELSTDELLEDAEDEDDEVFTFGKQHLKRYSFPFRAQRHCSTCRCNHHHFQSFRSVNKRVSEEIFNKEITAQKESMPITESALLPALPNGQNQRKICHLAFKNKDDDN